MGDVVQRTTGLTFNMTHQQFFFTADIFLEEKQGHVAGWCPRQVPRKVGSGKRLEPPRGELAPESVSLLLWEKEEVLWGFCDLGYFCGGLQARRRAPATASVDR